MQEVNEGSVPTQTMAELILASLSTAGVWTKELPHVHKGKWEEEDELIERQHAEVISDNANLEDKLRK